MVFGQVRGHVCTICDWIKMTASGVFCTFLSCLIFEIVGERRGVESFWIILIVYLNNNLFRTFHSVILPFEIKQKFAKTIKKLI